MPAVLEVTNLSKSIGDLTLFEDISFSVTQGEKTGLIARNGIGKTTLLNILTGQESYDSGKITFLPDTKIGYLPQEPNLHENETVLGSMFRSENPTINLIRDYELAISENNTTLVEKLSTQLDNLKAWDIENRISQMLSQLGIHDLNKKISELSGGQKKRVAMATILVDEPDFIILDEPTNHLDIEVISWLEGYLQRSRISLLMVTHDRFFLEKVCNEILELDERQVFKYRGNYSYYLQKRQERIEQRLKEIDKATNTLRKEEDWFRRMPQARATKAKYRIENYYDLKEKASQTTKDEKIAIHVSGERMGSKVLVAENLNFSWGGVKYLNDFNYTFNRFEKIGILGGNGCGKTTFIELLVGKLKAESGKIETGETIKFGYYRQKGIDFDEKMKVIDAVTSIAETITLGNGQVISSSQFLNHFMFHPSRQYDYIYKLSGGEKRRLYLCTILMQNPNFLILDEPTNDLDISTLEVLEEYLENFAGCVMVVSHDRYFLDQVVDHIFVFEGGGNIKDYPGNYSQYLEWKQKQKKEPIQKKETIATGKPSRGMASGKMSYKEKIEFEELEKSIAMLESEKQLLENELNSGKLSVKELQEKSERIGIIISDIEKKSERWFELAEKKGV